MSNHIIEEEHGTTTRRPHSRNGYYALIGPVVRSGGRLDPARRVRPTITGSYECRPDLPEPV